MGFYDGGFGFLAKDCYCVGCRISQTRRFTSVSVFSSIFLNVLNVIRLVNVRKCNLCCR